VYACAPGAVFLGKDLVEVAPSSSGPGSTDEPAADGREEPTWVS
jgi:hypothetical protein